MKKCKIGESADIEEMARLIDGDMGHFGFSAALIKIGKPEPEYDEECHFGSHTGSWNINNPQFGFANKPDLFEIRYYRVRVERD